MTLTSIPSTQVRKDLLTLLFRADTVMARFSACVLREEERDRERKQGAEVKNSIPDRFWKLPEMAQGMKGDQLVPDTQCPRHGCKF